MAPIPQYFLVRPDVKQQTQSGTVVVPGAMVPLIAVDQLPDWFDIDGIPRELEAKEVSGMINLGRGVRRDGLYDIRLHTETVLRMLAAIKSDDAAKSSTRSKSVGSGSNTEALTKQDAPVAVQRLEPTAQGQSTADTEAKKAEHNNEQASSIHNRTQTLLHPSQDSAEPMLQASRHATPNTTVSPLERHQQVPPHFSPTLREGNKVTKLQQKNSRDMDQSHISYCRHWCHHGTCKWGLNCRHEHTMPTTLEGLQEVGLKNFPSWFITAMGWTLSGMSMSPMNFGVGTMGISPVMSRMGMFGHGGGAAAKKAKKLRDIMGAEPVPVSQGSLPSSANTANLEPDATQGMKMMQVNRAKPGLTIHGSSVGSEVGNITVQTPGIHSLPALRPVCETATPGLVTGVVVGKGGTIATNPQEKLVDI